MLSPARSYRWVLALAATLLFSACLLRAVVAYRDDPRLMLVLALLMAWPFLFTSQPLVSRRWVAYFPIYLTLQTLTILAVLLTPFSPDYFAALFGVMSLQCLERFPPPHEAAWVGVFAIVTILALAKTYGVPKALGLGLVPENLSLAREVEGDRHSPIADHSLPESIGGAWRTRRKRGVTCQT